MSVASTFERQMLDLINAERASVGVAPLALELRLNDASEDHSVWMDQSLTFSHTGAGGSDPGDRMRASGFEFEGQWTWGENIAYQSERGAPGIADDVVDLHTALMNSPGHRANILNPNFDLIGIGIEVGDNRGFDAVYVTQNFAATAAPVQLDTGGSNPTPPGILFGTNGNDRLDGTAGADEIRTGNGDDRLDGLGGDDTIHGGAGSDSIAAGAGNDRVFGGAQHDTLNGGAGNDRVQGGEGADRIDGGAGDDTLSGGDGNDRLTGGAGNDRMSGGQGADIFVFTIGRDVVKDFDPDAAGERVDLSGAEGIGSYRELVDGNHLRQAGDHVVVVDRDGDRLILRDVDMTDLAANDFLF